MSIRISKRMGLLLILSGILLTSELPAPPRPLNTYDYSLIFDVAKICKATYSPDEFGAVQGYFDSHAPDWSLQYVQLPNQALGYVKAQCGSLNVLAYRGVKSGNTFADLVLRSDPVPLNSIAPFASSMALGRCHREFLKYYNELYSNRGTISTTYNLKDAEDQSFIIAGHSMGGALAQLGGFELFPKLEANDSNTPNPEGSLLTFAAPAFLANTAPQQLEARFPKNSFMRIYCGYDPVSKITRGGAYNIFDLQDASDPNHEGHYRHWDTGIQIGTPIEGLLGHKIETIIDILSDSQNPPQKLIKHWQPEQQIEIESFFSDNHTFFHIGFDIGLRTLKSILSQLMGIPHITASLKSISFAKTTFDNLSAQALKKSLPNLSNVTEITVGSLNLSPKGAKNFRKALERSSNLKHVTVMNMKSSPAALESMLQSLSTNKNLESFIIMGGQTQGHQEVMCQAFERHPHLPPAFLGSFLPDQMQRISDLKQKRAREHGENPSQYKYYNPKSDIDDMILRSLGLLTDSNPEYQSGLEMANSLMQSACGFMGIPTHHDEEDEEFSVEFDFKNLRLGNPRPNPFDDLD